MLFQYCVILDSNKTEKIHEQKNDQGTVFSTVARSTKDSIAPQNEDVNNTTKYSMQESENNSFWYCVILVHQQF